MDEDVEAWKTLREHAGFFLQVLSDISTAADRLSGSQYMSYEMAVGYITATHTASGAVRWILLPEEREVIKKHKPAYEAGKNYYPEMEYTEGE